MKQRNVFPFQPISQLPYLPDFRCPRSFVKLGSGCYYFSRDRMGWIEAKKTCELMTEGGRLVHIETPAERDLLLKQVAKQSRSRFEYWTAGNDIDEENRWVWAGGEADKVREGGDELESADGYEIIKSLFF